MSFGMMEALLSFFRRQVGLRTDTADVAGSLHAKTKNIDILLNSVNTLINSGINSKQLIASDNLRFSIDDQVYHNAGEYKLVRMIVPDGNGTIRVSFKLSSSVDVIPYCMIATQGITFSTVSTSATHTIDIPVAKGVPVEIWIRRGPGSTGDRVSLSNLNVYFDYVSQPEGGGIIY